MAKVKLWLRAFVSLAVLELRNAGIGLAIMVGLGVAAGTLLITGWLGLLAVAVMLLVQSGIIGWATALLLAVLMSFAGAAVCVLVILKRSGALLFRASRRQLGIVPAGKQLE